MPVGRINVLAPVLTVVHRERQTQTSEQRWRGECGSLLHARPPGLLLAVFMWSWPPFETAFILSMRPLSISIRCLRADSGVCVRVCVRTQRRTLLGPDHRQDTTTNGRWRGYIAQMGGGVDISVWPSKQRKSRARGAGEARGTEDGTMGFGGCFLRLPLVVSRLLWRDGGSSARPPDYISFVRCLFLGCLRCATDAALQ